MPQESLLIDILKKSMRKERALMIFLSRQHDLTLKSLMEQIEGLDAFNDEHKTKTSAVVNFVSKGSSGKKAHAKKQNSGRSSGKDHVKLRCLVCDRDNHLVRDCRDPRKADWIKNRQKQQEGANRNRKRDKKDRG